MKRKFKSGDRVRVKPNSWSPWVRCYSSDGVDYVGTVIDYYIEDVVLVKFDNFTDGFNGSVFYSRIGINYDPYNRQHLYVREENLCLLEGEIV